MKNILVLLAIAAMLLLFLSLPAIVTGGDDFVPGEGVQAYFEDTVWTRKTDQVQGFYMVKFSNNDSLIVGHGYEMDMFYDAKTGEEIMRIPGNNEVFFFNNDQQFIKLNYNLNRFEIFSTDSFQVIDTLENDDTKIYAISDISKDERYLTSIIQGGIRIWDLDTKKIISTKYFPSEENLEKFNANRIKFLCDGTKIIASFYKEYKNPNYPYTPITRLYHPIFDFFTLDSIDTFEGMADFNLSTDCLKIVFKRTDPDYGVEVYDFNTKELLWKLPINGPSLTGIEFSPDDKYLVTSSGPGTNAMIIWDMETGMQSYKYSGSSFRNFDISNDGKYIVESVGRWLELLYARFVETLVSENKKQNQLIYPNPTTGTATIQFNQTIGEITNINLIDINGLLVREVFSGYLEEGPQTIEFNTEGLPVGTYLVNVSAPHTSLSFKLLVSK